MLLKIYMRIAVCLSGISHNNIKNKLTNESNNTDIMKNKTKNTKIFSYTNTSILTFKNNYDILYKYHDNIDFFIHTWCTNCNKCGNNCEIVKEIIELYKPKKFICEKQIIFHSKLKEKYDKLEIELFKRKSMFYSKYKSILLKEEYEKENNFTYDFILHTRFDTMFLSKINFKKLNNNLIYTPYACTFKDGDKNISKGAYYKVFDTIEKRKKALSSDKSHLHTKNIKYPHHIYDSFFITNSKNIKFLKIMELYDSDKNKCNNIINNIIQSCKKCKIKQCRNNSLSVHYFTGHSLLLYNEFKYITPYFHWDIDFALCRRYYNLI